MTFGVVPTYAETGYGYIKAGPPTGTGHEARIVEGFAEKPNADDAAAFIETGSCYWNSGIFVFKAERYLRELDIHAASIRHAVKKAH